MSASSTANPVPETPAARRRKLPLTVAAGSAWLFALGTLAMLAVFIARPPADGDGWVLASTTVGGTTYDAFGLTYRGGGGTALLWFEAVVLLGAVVASVLPATAIRRVGHGVLVLWAALWLANGIWLVALDGIWWLWSLWIAAFAWFFLCTVLRAARGWRRTTAAAATG